MDFNSELSGERSCEICFYLLQLYCWYRPFPWPLPTFLHIHTHTRPNRSPPFSLNNPTKPIKPPPSVSSAPATAATPGLVRWTAMTIIKLIPCNNAKTKGIPSLPVPSPLILPDNAPTTAPILQNVSKTVPAPARKPALPKLHVRAGT